MPKRDFNKFAKHLFCNCIWHGFSPVNLQRIFRIFFLKNSSGGGGHSSKYISGDRKNKTRLVIIVIQILFSILVCITN